MPRLRRCQGQIEAGERQRSYSSDYTEGMSGFCLPKCEVEARDLCVPGRRNVWGPEQAPRNGIQSRSGLSAKPERSGLVSGASGYGVVLDSDGERSNDGSGGADELDDRSSSCDPNIA